MAVSNSPCAACKFLRRKCTQECVFAPYFPPDDPQKFACVHKVFGASNVAKILNDLHPSHREHAVASLSYEADMRLRDPVYGCVGLISHLQLKLKQLQTDLFTAKKELSAYVGPSSVFRPHPHMILPLGFPADQYVDPVIREQQELLRSYERQQQDVISYNARFVFDENHPTLGGGGQAHTMDAPLPIVTADGASFDNQFQLLQQPQPIQSVPLSQLQHTGAPGEGAANAEPSC